MREEGYREEHKVEGLINIVQRERLTTPGTTSSKRISLNNKQKKQKETKNKRKTKKELSLSLNGIRQISPAGNTYSTKTFWVQYTEEVIDINEAVHFRIDVPDLESQNILLEVELLFTPEERYAEEKSDGEEGRSQRRSRDGEGL